jgi:hypothetical protein
VRHDAGLALAQSVAFAARPRSTFHPARPPECPKRRALSGFSMPAPLLVLQRSAPLPSSPQPAQCRQQKQPVVSPSATDASLVSVL